MDQMHMTGISNGGMFSWYLAAAEPDFMGKECIKKLPLENQQK